MWDRHFGISCSEKGLPNFLSWSCLTSKIHHLLPRLLELTQVVEDIEIRSGLTELVNKLETPALRI